ncbi:BTB/POZ domain-containing protein KCTD19-like isoform X2 [Silurus meridionalis]|uniref:BTB/POZ domain-containing protein KCTD19-like isoform X2 n=1 Tax=Silurus meridionalis TaxID=175797 RepID=UPI001EEA2DBC|nr:BTB/POZ domain-containing protein KCTD19-like isoform X2 [Silurus meridionalis]
MLYEFAMEEEEEERCSFNVGGCVFSIPLNRLASFQDSLLLKSACVHADKSSVFLDRDGCTFRHVSYYISTGKLTSESALEMNILHELAASLHLTALQQALENPETTDCWKIHPSKCKPEYECSFHKIMTQGLVSTPLVDSQEEVLYCFLLLEHVRLHPGLITHDNLLWLCEDVAIIECRSHLFRFIANFLQSGTVLLPDFFSEYAELYGEARMVGVTGFIETLMELSDWSSSSDSCSEYQMCCTMEPLYVLSLSLLVRYPDSSLGQLCVDSSLEGSRLYITGSGVLFQHVEKWLGTSLLPLTRTKEELPCLYVYLNNQDGVYLAIREAMQEFFYRRETTGCMTPESWSASVSTFTLYKIVNVYAGTRWYATYFKTLIKHPELLSNSNKSKWIVFGESLLVKGDGKIFRHILNFLRCGRLLLPADFREWPLLCQEIEAFQIPALSSALQNCSDYRAWCKSKAQPRKLFTSCTDEDALDSSPDKEESLSIKKESPDNTLLSSKTPSAHSENKAVCVTVGASEITEVRPAATEKAERTEGISLTSVLDHSTLFSNSSCSHEELMMENSSKLPPDRAACTGVFEDCWNREKASIMHMLQDNRQKQDSPLLGQMATLMETSLSSRSMQMLLEVSDTEKSDLIVALFTAFCNNWQSDTGSAQREHTHFKERLTHNTHMHRKPNQNPSRDLRPNNQMAMQKASLKSSVFPITSFTLPVGGCVLTVAHPTVLGRGEAGGYFTHSIIYTDEQPQMVQAAGKEGSDVAFAYFNMSYEEMVYARECHAFLTGTILDSSRLNAKERTVRLVHHLWVGHMGVDNFVQEILTMIKVRPHKQLEKQEKLLQWVKFTLPLAKRYTECVKELLRKTHTISLFSTDLLEVTIPTQKRF